MNGPAVCPNGHAMDDGLFECPACGAYRPSMLGRELPDPDGSNGLPVPSRLLRDVCDVCGGEGRELGAETCERCATWDF